MGRAHGDYAGLLATIVTATAPADLRGTAYGMFNLMSGIAMLIASILAGLPRDHLAASFTFYVGAIFCVIALVGLIKYQNDMSTKKPSDVPKANPVCRSTAP